nr:hypothetical protein [Hyphomonas neptunium]
MLQGTGSDVGKSILSAAICRIAKRRGLNVAPFRPQNMSNNASACASDGEISRAQALQAMACGLVPHTDFNPVLLKPETDRPMFDLAGISHGARSAHGLIEGTYLHGAFSNDAFRRGWQPAT